MLMPFPSYAGIPTRFFLFAHLRTPSPLVALSRKTPGGEKAQCLRRGGRPKTRLPVVRFLATDRRVVSDCAAGVWPLSNFALGGLRSVGLR